jgi:hypothetical protein
MPPESIHMHVHENFPKLHVHSKMLEAMASKADEFLLSSGYVIETRPTGDNEQKLS